MQEVENGGSLSLHCGKISRALAGFLGFRVLSVIRLLGDPLS
jgi:hypothetical protein